MKEKIGYAENLEMIVQFFNGRRVLSIGDMSRFMECDPHVLRNDKRLADMMFDYGQQKRITITNFARYLT